MVPKLLSSFLWKFFAPLESQTSVDYRYLIQSCSEAFVFKRTLYGVVCVYVCVCVMLQFEHQNAHPASKVKPF